MKCALLLMLGLFGLLSATSPVLAGTESQYRYVAWIGNEALIIERPSADSLRGAMKSSGDVTLELEFCEEVSDYICFFSGLHAFAVPKRLSRTVREWTVHGVRFELVADGLTISLLGRRLDDLFLIRTPAEATVLGRETGKPALSLFSPTYGLVGFYLPRELRTYWMDGASGFGAPPTAVHSAPDTR